MRITVKGMLMSMFFSSLLGCQMNQQENNESFIAPKKNNYLQDFYKKGRQRSPLDKRQMRYLTLDNGMKVLLVSNEKFTKSAAAMDVAVGSLADPDQSEGLAHFLEHMLFLGTKKYPKVGEYSEYLSANQGMSNAYTASENTNYFFEVNNDAFTGALDRFAQFFVAPLFDEAYVKREVNAVHSEHQKNLSNDSWRFARVLETFMQKDHPQRKFSTGTLETLGKVKRAELLDFYEKRYSANLMTLAMLSPLSLDEQEKLVREKFSAVKNRNLSENSYPSKLYNQEEMPRYIYIKPVKDLRTIDLVFAAPSIEDHWRTKPLDLLSLSRGA